jgi:N-acyl-D-aspartate/D-glutamate deacylase
MGEDASTRRTPTADELGRMKTIVAEAMAAGAIGLGASYSPNHSGHGGVPMPSTITDFSEFDALVGAMGPRGKGVVQIAAGTRGVEEFEGLSTRYGRPCFMSAAVTMYNEQEPGRAIGIFEACAAVNRRGGSIHIQIPCQPLSFDFTMANAYPFYSHEAFGAIKAYTPEQLKPVFRDPGFRARFRDNISKPKPGLIFQGNWDRVMIAATALEKNAKLANRMVDEVARERGCDPLDLVLDLSLEEDLQTAFLGKFLNVVEDGVARLLKHEAGVIALSDAGAHLIYMCDAGFGLNFLGHWVRERGDFDLVEGVRRITSHQADLYGIPDRGRVAVGAHADLLLFDPATVGISPARRLQDLPGGGRRTIRDPKGVHGVFVNGVKVFDAKGYARHAKGPGQVLDRFKAGGTAAVPAR